MMNVIDRINARYVRNDIPDVRAGDDVKVHVQIKEGEKERVQIFQGRVIAVGGKGIKRTFTVRKISSGIGVERVFPLHSPRLSKIEIVSFGRVRRSKLYYLRNRRGKAARIKSKKNRNGRI